MFIEIVTVLTNIYEFFRKFIVQYIRHQKCYQIRNLIERNNNTFKRELDTIKNFCVFVCLFCILLQLEFTSALSRPDQNGVYPIHAAATHASARVMELLFAGCKDTEDGRIYQRFYSFDLN